MKNYLLIGINSDIAKATIFKLEDDQTHIYSTSRQKSPSHESIKHHIQVDPVKGSFPDDFLPEKINGLVYFPGTINLKPFRGLKPEHFQEDLDINFMGALKAIQWALKRMDDKSSIVLFSTVAVQKGMPFHASIASAKGAIEGLTRSLAAELSPKIRVNCIAPSLTNTKLSERLLNSDKKMESSKERHPLKEIGDPNDIAEMVSYLLTDKSRWVTGQIMHVDGGMSVI